jgi:acetate kinase
VLVDPDVTRALEELTALAPLHQPKSLAALAAVAEALPGTANVACFDTAFHATLPAEAATYALPEEWRERWGLRRYGFHGLAHAWVARRALELGGARTLRHVNCHLGAGASLAAVRDGRSVETTMGFTPLEGLVMATRSGSVDPGLVLWLLAETGLDRDEVADALEHRSGLAGLGGTADMRELLAQRRDGDERARLAWDVYVHRLRAGIAAMASALGGLDVLTFSGGVGENVPEMRFDAAAGLGFLGVAIDPARNESAAGEAEIGAPGAAVRAFVVPSREDLEIARAVEELLA